MDTGWCTEPSRAIPVVQIPSDFDCSDQPGHEFPGTKPGHLPGVQYEVLAAWPTACAHDLRFHRQPLGISRDIQAARASGGYSCAQTSGWSRALAAAAAAAAGPRSHTCSTGADPGAEGRASRNEHGVHSSWMHLSLSTSRQIVAREFQVPPPEFLCGIGSSMLDSGSAANAAAAKAEGQLPGSDAIAATDGKERRQSGFHHFGSQPEEIGSLLKQARELHHADMLFANPPMQAISAENEEPGPEQEMEDEEIEAAWDD